MIDSESEFDKVFLSYNKILKRFKIENVTTKNNKEISHKDLRRAINLMNKKHSKCRWVSEKNNSRRYLVLIEGYCWLKLVAFQKGKKQIDADIDFFENRIKEYEKLLNVDSKNMFNKNIAYNELEKFLNRKKDTIRKIISKIEKEKNIKYKIDNTTYISAKGIEIMCKNYFKDKYLQLLEDYKMELTEQYIKAGYLYDNFFGKN